MFALHLERFGPDLDATWGRLVSEATDDHWFTVEPPWDYNRRFKSCIPDGVYDLVRHDSPSRPGSWAMVGPGVSHIEEPGVARYACLIHTANWARELDGCIAPGTSIRYFGGGQAVADSRNALDRIDEILKAATDPKIEIVSLGGIG